LQAAGDRGALIMSPVMKAEFGECIQQMNDIAQVLDKKAQCFVGKE
jgi:hypothetical protein